MARLNAGALSGSSLTASTTQAKAVEQAKSLIRPDEKTTVVNVAGRRVGSTTELHRVNAWLPEVVSLALHGTGAALVHVGSAAEYGDVREGILATEDAHCEPVGEYGRSKLLGTMAVTSIIPASTVLRPFNIVDANLPPGSPLADLAARVRSACEEGSRPEVLSSSTTRDFVSLQFISKSLESAVRNKPAGIYNLCSGVGVSMGELALAMQHQLGHRMPLTDLDQRTLAWVVGNPSKWLNESGLQEALGVNGVVETLMPGLSGGSHFE